MLITVTNYLVNEGELLHSLWCPPQEINSLSELTTTRHFRCYWTISGITLRLDKTQEGARGLDARSVVRKNAGVLRSRLVFLTRSVVPLQLPVPAMLLPEPVRAWFRLLDTNPCLPACLPATRRKYNLDEEYGIVFCRVALSSLVWSSCTNWLLNTTYRGS